MLSLVVGVMMLGAPDDVPAYVSVRIPEAARELPLTVMFKQADLAMALDVPELEPGDLGVFALIGEAAHALPWQVDEDPEGRLCLSFIAPAGTTEVRVIAGGREVYPPVDVTEPLSVERDGESVVVRNGHYSVTHSPTALGGLPSRIEFAATGKVLDRFAFNDRLHDPDLGGFLVRNDAASSVEVVGSGPVCVTVRVRAAYVGGAAPDGAPPTATYTFRYFAGSPLIAVDVTARQEPAYAWSEFHFLELNWPDESFSRWVAEAAPDGAELKADESTHSARNWAAVTDGANVLGLLWRGDVLVYDGRGGYGTYLHGPWARWDSKTISYRAHLFIGAPDEGASAVAAASAGLSQAGALRVASSIADVLSRRVREQASDRATWAESIARRPIAEGMPGQAVRRLRAVLAALDDGGDPIRAALDDAEASYHALGEGRLRALVRLDGSGATLESLFDAKAGRECATGRQPLWRATFETDRDQRLSADSAATFLRCEAEERDGALHLAWSAPREAALEGTVAEQDLSVSGPRLASRLRVRSGEGAGLWTVTPLTVELRSLGDSGQDDWGLAPLVSGQCTPNPCTNGLAFDGDYPSGWCSLQFGALYDAGGGVYFGCQDPGAGH